MRSTTSVEGQGSSTSFRSRSCKRLVQACSRSQMLERGDCERRNFPLPVIDSVICEVCSRFFRRLSDMKRHERVAERCLLLPMQRGSRQWGTCSLWFASVGGLTIHRCLGAQSASGSSLCSRSVSSSGVQVIIVAQHIVLHLCGRCSRSSAGYCSHNCNRGKRLT